MSDEHKSVPGEDFPAVSELPEEDPTPEEELYDVDEGSVPREDGAFDATTDEQLRGIVTQVRADLALHPGEDATVLLTERLRDASLDVSEDQFEVLLTEVTHGDPTLDLQPGVGIEPAD